MVLKFTLITGLQKSDAVPSWNNSPVPMKRTSSALSLPASTVSSTSPHSSQSSLTTGASERKAHTDPGAQRAQVKKWSRAKAQLYIAGKRSQHCTTVPEEESSSTGNVSRQPLSLQLPGGTQYHMVPSFPSSQAPLQQRRERHTGPDAHGKLYHDSRSQTPSTLNEQHSLYNAPMSVTPTRSKRNSSNMRPSSSLSMGEDLRLGSMHLGSTTPRASLSTPASEQWSVHLDPDSPDEREPSFPHSELEHSGESNSLNPPSHGMGLSHPYLHNSSYPQDGDAHSACSNPFPSGYHDAEYPYTEYPVHSSLPATLTHPRYHFQNQFGQRPHHMSLHHQSQQQG